LNDFEPQATENKETTIKNINIMNEVVLKLKPEGVWKEFQGIMGVPRPSKREEKMVAYLEKWAKDHKVESKKNLAATSS